MQVVGSAVLEAVLLCNLMQSGAAVHGDDVDGTPTRGTLVMFVADDLGWNDVGWRNPTMSTPTLDRLRAESVELVNYYVQCVCSPSRGSLLTGQFPMHLGYDSVIHASEPMGVPLDVRMLPQALATAAVSSHQTRQQDAGA